MKIVRLISLACLVSLLAACGSETITGPDAPPPAAEPALNQTVGIGQLGSGN